MEPIKAYFTREGWKRDWEKTKSHVKALGRILYEMAGGSSGEWKQSLIDYVNYLGSAEYQGRQFAEIQGLLDARQRRAIQANLVALGRPDLAYPHRYAVSASEPLETIIATPVDFYKVNKNEHTKIIQ